MCGIAGFYDPRAAFCETKAEQTLHTNTLIAMRKAIAHRGKDQTGEYLKNRVGLAHTRLSIRDLSGGIQPMVRQAGGKTAALVYNGELYNTDELLPDLRRLGLEPTTTTDTEVLLLGYLAFGISVVERLNGIFAFALWDEEEEILWLVRDRLGVKPLFYAQKGSLLLFGSEIKALFAHPACSPALDEDSLRVLFGLGPARPGGCGVFAGVQEVRAGHLLRVQNGRISDTAYWDLESRPHTDSYEETVDTVSFLVRDAVRRQMVSDVPVASFLSGGIDSSIVTALASRCLAKEGAILSTFSFDFAGNDRYFEANAFQPERDRPYVQLMLAQLSVSHTELVCEEHRLADELFPAMRAKDLPGMADVDASLLYFCRLAAQQNKVVLTGECADEIFGGYPWFYRPELLNADGFPWSRHPEVRESLLRDEWVEKLQLRAYTREVYEQSLREVPPLSGEAPQEARRRAVSYLNIKWFLQTLLDRMDRTSMASGLEARVPFADHRIAEYLFNVPWAFKAKDGLEKRLLRDACSDLLPEALLWRKKSPYPKTYDPAYEELLEEQAARLLQTPGHPVWQFLDPKKVTDFLRQPKSCTKPWFGQLMAGPQLLAYLLQFADWLLLYDPTFNL